MPGAARNYTDILRCVRLLALDVLGLGSFVTGHNVENNSFAFIKRLETNPRNRRMMHEHVRPTFLNDETEPVLVIEPFHLPLAIAFLSRVSESDNRSSNYTLTAKSVRDQKPLPEPHKTQTWPESNDWQ